MKSSLSCPDPVLPRPSGQRGSTLFIILIAVALFAALSYAISRSSSSGKDLTQEKTHMLATEILDTGNRLAETVSVMRLHGTKDTELSFEYDGNYVNAACLDETCKVFSFDGGGINWETPAPGANNGEDWAYTGDIAISSIGTDAADLVAILPGLSVGACHRINVVLGLEAESAAPPVMSDFSADHFTGTYNVAPVNFNPAALSGQKSGCFNIASLSGTVVAAPPLLNTYVFYQVLRSR